jgi:hypothetical protein
VPPSANKDGLQPLGYQPMPKDTRSALSSQPVKDWLFGVFKCVDRGLTRYGREIVKKFVKGLSAFDVIQERLKRNPRPAKDGRTTKNSLDRA